MSFCHTVCPDDFKKEFKAPGTVYAVLFRLKNAFNYVIPVIHVVTSHCYPHAAHVIRSHILHHHASQ